MSKRHIQTDVWRMRELMRDVTAEPISRDYIFRPERSRENYPTILLRECNHKEEHEAREQRGASDCLVDNSVLNTRSVYVVPVRGFPARMSWIKRHRLESSSSAVKSISNLGRPSHLMAGLLRVFLVSRDHKPKVSLYTRSTRSFCCLHASPASLHPREFR